MCVGNEGWRIERNKWIEKSIISKQRDNIFVMFMAKKRNIDRIVV